MVLPISGSADEMLATWAIWSFESTSTATARIASTAAIDGGLDALLQGHRVGAGGHVLQAVADHRPGEDGGGGGAVAGHVVGLLRDFLDELGADLLVRVLEVDLLGDGDAVVGDRGGAPLLLEDDVAALGAKRDAHGVGQLVHAGLETATSLVVEGDDLGHRRGCPPYVVVQRLALAQCDCQPVNHSRSALATREALTVPPGSAPGDGGDDGDGLAIGHGGVELLQEAHVVVRDEHVHEAPQAP